MKPHRCFVLLAAATALLNVAAASSFAQATFPDPQGRQAVPGAVQMCLSAQGYAVPCGLQDAIPVPGVAAPFSQPSADQKAQVVVLGPNGIALTPIVSTAAENNHIFKNAPGRLYSAYATNLTATAGFLVVLNSTTVPGDGAITPLACVPLPANGAASINYNPGPTGFYATGIVAVVTSATTCFTKTTGTITAFISGAVQ